MAGNSYKLEILTPLKKVYEGEVEHLVANGVDGLFGVLFNHAPMLSGLSFGPLYLRMSGGQQKEFVVSDGFFEVKNNVASLLVDTAESKEDIDIQRAKEAKERAEKRLQERGKDTDVDRAHAALVRAITRLKVAQ